MVEVGDEIELATQKVGQAPRTGIVIAVRERLVTVRWPTGEQSTLVPSPGTVTVRPVKRNKAKTKPSTKSTGSERTSTRKKTTGTKAAKVKRVSDATSKKSSGKKQSR